MADKNVEIILSAKDKAGRVIKEVSRDLNKFGVNTKNLKRGLLAITATMAGVTVAMGKFAKEASSALSIEESFNRLSKQAGVAGDDIISKLKEVSAGTVNNADLMLSANRAMSLGVAKNMEDFTTLMEIARLKGREMGLTTTQAFNDIVTGIGRASPMILDNLGITIKAGEAQTMYAQTLGKTADQLTESEKKQALLNAVMTQGAKDVEQAGELQLTAKEKMEALTASWDNFKVTIGATVLTGLTPFIERMTAFANDPKVQARMQAITASVVEFGVTWLPVVIDTLNAFIDTIKFWTDGIVGAIQMIDKMIEKVRQLSNILKESSIGGSANFQYISAPGRFTPSGGDVGKGSFMDRLMGFDNGGVVGGPRGSAQLAVVHGGETILPTHKKGATTGNVININNPVLLDDTMIDRVSQSLARTLRNDMRI